MKATAVALLAAALLVAAASSERLPTFGEYLQQTPAGAASKAKTANADYPSVETEEVQFVSVAEHDCRCFDGYWNNAFLNPPAGRCPTLYAQYDLACASKENYGYGYDYNSFDAIPVAVAVGRCAMSENYFTPIDTNFIPVSTGVAQIGTFTGTCELAESVEDCEGRGPACGGMVVNVKGSIFSIAELYLKGMPAAMTFTDDCKEVFSGVASGRRTARTRKAGRAEVASYRDDDERPYYERRDEYYSQREQYYSGYERKYGYDEPMFYKAAGSVYHGTMTVVSAHKSAQAFETVGTFQYIFVDAANVANTTVPHPPPHAFITKGNTFTLGFFKGGKY